MDSVDEWKTETVFHSAKDYFVDILSEFVKAKKSIFVEAYIFRNDLIGQVIIDSLLNCSKKGIEVKVMVDGFGSSDWEKELLPQFAESSVKIKTYHPLPWPFSKNFDRFWDRLGYINRRNHRKLIIVDETTCFLGSLNITDTHAAWKDIGVKVTHGRSDILLDSFHLTWERSGQEIQRSKISDLSEKVSESHSVFLNISRTLRKNKNREIAQRIKSAKKRVWVRSPYFLPSPRVLDALKLAAQNGIDVKVMLSSKSDVPTSNWLARLFYPHLIEAGVKIYEYEPKIMHAKSIVCDDWVLIGSSNMNQRSLRHDLEVDVVLSHPESISIVCAEFTKDVELSQPHQKIKTTFLEFFGARIMWLFRRWF